MREILILDRNTGLPKRIDGTVPEWALDRMRRAEDYCRSKGWSTNLEELSPEQVEEVQQALYDA